MKHLIPMFLLLGSGVLPAQKENKADLLAGLFERAEENALEIGREAVAMAEDFAARDKLKPAEERSTRALVGLIRHARDSKDKEGRLRLLHLEYHWMFLNSLSDIETAEGAAERTAATKEAEEYVETLGVLHDRLAALEGWQADDELGPLFDGVDSMVNESMEGILIGDDPGEGPTPSITAEHQANLAWREFVHHVRGSEDEVFRLRVLQTEYAYSAAMAILDSEELERAEAAEARKKWEKYEEALKTIEAKLKQAEKE